MWALVSPQPPGATAAAATHIHVAGPREGHLQVMEAGGAERVEPVSHLLGAEAGRGLRPWGWAPAPQPILGPVHSHSLPPALCPLKETSPTGEGTKHRHREEPLTLERRRYNRGTRTRSSKKEPAENQSSSAERERERKQGSETSLKEFPRKQRKRRKREAGRRQGAQP